MKALNICFRKTQRKILSSSQLKTDGLRIPLTKMSDCSLTYCHPLGRTNERGGKRRLDSGRIVRDSFSC